jgi:hypothetical protein
MRNFYYSIVSSSLVGAKSSDPNSFRITAYIIISVISCLNLFTVNMWLNALGICDMMNLVEVDIISKKSLLSGQIRGLLNYGVLSLIINYFIVYYKNNYKLILEKYPQKNGKLIIYYTATTILIMILTAIVLKWLRSMGFVEELTYMQPLWVLKLF